MHTAPRLMWQTKPELTPSQGLKKALGFSDGSTFLLVRSPFVFSLLLLQRLEHLWWICVLYKSFLLLLLLLLLLTLNWFWTSIIFYSTVFWVFFFLWKFLAVYFDSQLLVFIKMCHTKLRLKCSTEACEYHFRKQLVTPSLMLIFDQK